MIPFFCPADFPADTTQHFASDLGAFCAAASWIYRKYITLMAVQPPDGNFVHPQMVQIVVSGES